MDLDGLFDNPAVTGAQWSVDLRRSAVPVYQRRGDLLLETASVAKIFLLTELAVRIAEGAVDPGAMLDRRSVAPVGDSGLWQHLMTDQIPVSDAARLVGSVSDNLATNVLIALVGLESVQARAGQMAPGGSTLHDLVRDARTAGMPATLSEGCASDWASILHDLHRGMVEGDAVSASVLGWLSAGADLSMVAAAFDLDPLSHASGAEQGGVRLWNKTGTDASVRADVGLLEHAGSTWTYAVICNWDHHDQELRGPVLRAMREVGSAIRRSG